MDLSDLSVLCRMDPVERKGLDKEIIVWNTFSCVSGTLLVSADRTFVYENIRRRRLLAASLAAASGSCYSICVLHYFEKYKRNLSVWSVFAVHVSPCTGRKKSLVCRVVRAFYQCI